MLQSYPIHANSTLQPLLSIHHCHLDLICIDFQVSSPSHINKTFSPLPLGLLRTRHTKASHLHTRGHSHTLHSHFHFFHHCVHIHIERKRDMIQPCLTPISILKHSLSPLSFLLLSPPLLPQGSSPSPPYPFHLGGPTTTVGGCEMALVVRRRVSY